MLRLFGKSFSAFALLALMVGTSLVLTTVLPPSLVWSAAPANLNGATITGKITLDGAAPQPKAISMRADPGCEKKHSTRALDQAITVGPGNTLANVLVSIRSGLPNKTYPVPEEPVVLNQDGCLFQPRVVAVMAGQTVRLVNSDGLSHNVRALPRWNRAFNVSTPPTDTPVDRSFARPEVAIPMKCDIHPWMKGSVAVLRHPFFDVTGSEGNYAITGLEPGTYEIEVWHETLGTKVSTVTVGAGQSATLDFTLNSKK